MAQITLPMVRCDPPSSHDENGHGGPLERSVGHAAEKKLRNASGAPGAQGQESRPRFAHSSQQLGQRRSNTDDGAGPPTGVPEPQGRTFRFAPGAAKTDTQLCLGQALHRGAHASREQRKRGQLPGLDNPHHGDAPAARPSRQMRDSALGVA
jgi:hypothetical protein